MSSLTVSNMSFFIWILLSRDFEIMQNREREDFSETNINISILFSSYISMDNGTG